MNLASYLEKVNTPQTKTLFGGSVAAMIENMRAYIWGTPPTDPGPLTQEGYTLIDGTSVPAGEVVRRNYRMEVKKNCKILTNICRGGVT